MAGVTNSLLGLLIFFSCGLHLSAGISLLSGLGEPYNIKVQGKDSYGELVRICDWKNTTLHLQALEQAMKSVGFEECSDYIAWSCVNVGQRSQVSIRCSEGDSTNITKFLDSGGVIPAKFENVIYTISKSFDQIVNCEGALQWSGAICGCKLDNLQSHKLHYESMAVGDFIIPGQAISLRCDSSGVERYFPDYSQAMEVNCTINTDLAGLVCQTKSDLKSFDNKVAHFEGNLGSYVIANEPFSQELTELALCFWLRTKDSVGTIFSLANEDHWNALRFDTHTSHVHFTMAGLHTDHGLVPPIKLVDDTWRYFCANWRSIDGNATIYLRKQGHTTVEEYSEILYLSKGKSVRASGGKVALGNLWNEDVLKMTFNPIGSLEGDVMGLTLFSTTVSKDEFNSMFDGCSTFLDENKVVLSWKGLLSPSNELNVSATFGQQVCSKEIRYGESVINFPFSNEAIKLSNYVQNYAKIENAFSIDLSELTICAIVKSTVRIGTIFSYVTSTENGFTEEIVLEKHKTHMHFYMAGIDQQVGAVPSISINTARWYTTCFTWENSVGRWRAFLDGEEITSNKTGTLKYTVGKKIRGGGSCYLGIMKSFDSFREYRGFAGSITELNLWGKVLSPEEIYHMAKSNQVYEEDLLVSWGTLLENKRGNMTIEQLMTCGMPDELIGNGTFDKTGSNPLTKLYLVGDEIKYRCVRAAALTADSAEVATKTCTNDRVWEPVGTVNCTSCAAVGMWGCVDGSACVDKSKRCDGTPHCGDRSDESECNNTQIYWIVISVLVVLLLFTVPSVILLKRARRARAEALRVKRLTDTWEIKREFLQLEEKLGEGAFGKVFKGLLLTPPDYNITTTVAVKEISDIATERDKNMFIEEIRLSKKLGNHPNIVGIVGSIIVYEPYLLILEFVDGSDLLDYVQKKREAGTCDLSQEDQVFISWQIANGMEYVAGKNFVHRDLAARNVLISAATKYCKVTDFGLARDLYNYDEYQSEGGRLPIKWMSPEAIFELKFTSESDVWSYGVVLYELFSWGGTPYPGIDPSLLRDRLVNGFRMAAPNGTPDFIYSVMLQCWEFKSSDRPSFTNIRSFIQNHIQEYGAYVEFTTEACSEYINMAPQSPDDPTGPLTTAYTNIQITGDQVQYTVEPEQEAQQQAVLEEMKKKNVEYASVELVHRPEHDQIVPADVSIGIADSNGMCEVTRSAYMNT